MEISYLQEDCEAMTYITYAQFATPTSKTQIIWKRYVFIEAICTS